MTVDAYPLRQRGFTLLELALVLALLGVLIFGRRLPELGKSIGKGIVEFKKGLTGIEDEVKNAGSADTGVLTSGDSDSIENPETTDSTAKTNP